MCSCMHVCMHACMYVWYIVWYLIIPSHILIKLQITHYIPQLSQVLKQKLRSKSEWFILVLISLNYGSDSEFEKWVLFLSLSKSAVLLVPIKPVWVSHKVGGGVLFNFSYLINWPWTWPWVRNCGCWNKNSVSVSVSVNIAWARVPHFFLQWIHSHGHNSRVNYIRSSLDSGYTVTLMPIDEI